MAPTSCRRCGHHTLVTLEAERRWLCDACGTVMVHDGDVQEAQRHRPPPPPRDPDDRPAGARACTRCGAPTNDISGLCQPCSQRRPDRQEDE